MLFCKVSTFSIRVGTQSNLFTLFTLYVFYFFETLVVGIESSVFELYFFFL